jgi:hypothetical protein
LKHYYEKKIYQFLFYCQISVAQTEKYAEIVTYYHLHNNFNGAVVVATDGKIDYLSGIGIADRQADIKIKWTLSLRLHL